MEEKNKAANQALIFSIFGLIFSLIPIIGVPLQVIAVVKAYRGNNSEFPGRLAIASILVAIGLIISIISAIQGAKIGSQLGYDLAKQYQEITTDQSTSPDLVDYYSQQQKSQRLENSYSSCIGKMEEDISSAYQMIDENNYTPTAEDVQAILSAIEMRTTECEQLLNY